MPEVSRWSARERSWVRHPAKAKRRSLEANERERRYCSFGGHDMRPRLIVVSAAFVLALITVLAAPRLLRAQTPQAPQGQVQAGAQPGAQPAQGQPGEQPGQGQRGFGRGARGGRGNQPQGPSKPTPRWPDGHPRLGAPPEDKGTWGSCCGSL